MRYDRPAKTAANGPQASNAWTGYQNLYQDQENRIDRRWYGNQGNHQDVADGGNEQFDQSRLPEGKALTFEIFDNDDQHHIPEDQPFSPSLDLQNSIDEASNHLNHANPQIYQGMNGDLEQFHDEVFDISEDPQVAPLDATDPPQGYAEEIYAGKEFNTVVDSAQIPGYPSFPGTGKLTNINLNQSFSPWMTRGRQITSNNRFGILNPSSIGGAEAVDEVPLSGFWKPNRLY
ncbi:MAG: hypothetical protein Q9225_005344 [Loekoesia sp. 1 TL-2023]